MRICHGQTIEGFYGDVYVSQITGEKKSCFCGGTLVASNYVITAGHCLYEWNENTDRVTEKLKEWKIYVRIGEYNTELEDDTGIEKIFQVEEMIKHPKHDLEINDAGIEKTLGYDIAILRLKQDVDLTIYTPACLAPSSGGDQYVGQMGTAVGWGSTDINHPKVVAKIPHEIQLAVASSENCPSSSLEEPSMLCAGLRGGGQFGTCHVSEDHIYIRYITLM